MRLGIAPEKEARLFIQGDIHHYAGNRIGKQLEVFTQIRGKAVVEVRKQFSAIGTPDEETTCVHLGSKRRCCDELYICRESPGTNCITSGVSVSPVRSCETCKMFVAIPNVSHSEYS